MVLCGICNKSTNNKKFCSLECRNLGTRQRNIDNNPIYDPDAFNKMRESLIGRKQSDETKLKRSRSLTEYYERNPKQLGWPTLRRVVRQRDGSTCFNCKMMTSDPYIVHGVSLHGDRVIGTTLVDKDISHYVTCCRTCHKKLLSGKQHNDGIGNLTDEQYNRGIRYIPLTQGEHATVDVYDFNFLSRYNWFLNCGYAATWHEGKTIKMHRMIMRAKDDEYIDHVNRNRLDNRRDNLRIATISQNQANIPSRRTSKTGLKGVIKVSEGRYRVVIARKHVGYFGTPEQAAQAYDKKVKELFGEYACLNFPDKI